MKLYDFPFAPNPRKLRVYLAEKGIEVPLEMVNLVHGEHRTPEFLAKNPMGSLPVLELDDGTLLTESLAIMEYFEELHPEPPMIGTTPLERAQTRRLEAIANLNVLGPTARYIHASRSPLPGVESNQEVAKHARRALPTPLALFDTALSGRPFAAGPRVSIADCTLFAALKFAEMLEVDIEPGRHVRRWYAEFSQRPSAAA